MSKWSEAHVEYIISKLLFWLVYNISLIVYLWWVTNKHSISIETWSTWHAPNYWCSRVDLPLALSIPPGLQNYTSQYGGDIACWLLQMFYASLFYGNDENLKMQITTIDVVSPLTNLQFGRLEIEGKLHSICWIVCIMILLRTCGFHRILEFILKNNQGNLL